MFRRVRTEPHPVYFFGITLQIPLSYVRRAYPYPELLQFCMTFTPVPQNPEYGYNVFKPVRNSCAFYHYTPVLHYEPRTSMSSLRLVNPYPELLRVLYNLHTRNRNICKFQYVFGNRPNLTVPLHGSLLFFLSPLRTVLRIAKTTV